MAQQLRQACATNYPEDFECRLDIPGHITSCAFNSYGSVIAFGTNDGRIFLYDIVSAQIMRQFAGHFYPVTCLSWSRTNRLLLSSGADYQLICWNVYGDELDDALFTLDCLNSSPIINVQFHPRDEKFFLIDRMFHSSQLGRYSTSTRRAELTNIMPVRTRVSKKLNISSSGESHHEKPEHDTNKEAVRDSRRRIRSPPAEALLEIEEHWASKAVFDRSGKHIYCASDEGLVFVLKFTGDKQLLPSSNNSKQLVASFRVYNNKGGVVPVLQLALSKSRGHLALNCQDRTIRVFEMDKVLKAGVDRKCPSELKPHSEYHDQVNRRPWNNLIFSALGEFICAAADDTHQIHIWEIESMSLIKTLTPHGRKTNEVLADMQWHPTQPRLLSVANGLGFLWGHRFAEEWSAWNYKFTDLDENQDVEEREGEFDSVDEDEPTPIAAADDKKAERVISGSSTSQRIQSGSSQHSSKTNKLADEIVDVVGVGDDEPWLKNAAMGNDVQIVVPLQSDQFTMPASASTDEQANTSFDSGESSTAAASGPNSMIVPADTMNTDMALLAIYKGEVPPGLFISPHGSNAASTAATTPGTRKSTRSSGQPKKALPPPLPAAAASSKAVQKKPAKVSVSHAAKQHHPSKSAASRSSSENATVDTLREQKRTSVAAAVGNSGAVSSTPTSVPGRKITSSRPFTLGEPYETANVMKSGALPISSSSSSSQSVFAVILSPPVTVNAASSAVPRTSSSTLPMKSAASTAPPVVATGLPLKPPAIKRQDSWPSSVEIDDDDDDDDDDYSSSDSESSKGKEKNDASGAEAK